MPRLEAALKAEREVTASLKDEVRVLRAESREQARGLVERERARADAPTLLAAKAGELAVEAQARSRLAADVAALQREARLASEERDAAKSACEVLRHALELEAGRAHLAAAVQHDGDGHLRGDRGCSNSGSKQQQQEHPGAVTPMKTRLLPRSPPWP